ncbi:hypothetical protein [Endozoicomonas lisbonensis]|uniref:Uncharacterized protein n=1 Tax=Endozoicomonas lisbonensis TaxID=3120522 RepID=A0ABV2SFU0_9GAMM
MNSNKALQPLNQARQTMLEAGLPIPPVPRNLSDQLQCPDDARYFTTRDNIPGPWNLSWFLNEVEQKTPDHYLVFGIDGYGVESAATHYYLVENDFAIFHQSNLPTPSHPGLEADLADQYELIAIMAVAASEAREKGKLPENSRIVVVRPAGMPSSWGIQPAPGQPVQWQETSNALLDVCDWLKASVEE